MKYLTEQSRRAATIITTIKAYRAAGLINDDEAAQDEAAAAALKLRHAAVSEYDSLVGKYATVISVF